MIILFHFALWTIIETREHEKLAEPGHLFCCLSMKLQTDSVDASGLCCRTEEWKKFIHPMYQDPRFRNYIYEIPSDRISGGTLKGIHR